MTPEQIRADRDAGTPGPWWCHFGDDQTKCDCKYVLAEYGGMGSIATIDVCRRMEVVWGDDNGPPVDEAQANARRIARLPDLEDAYLAQAERIAELEAVLQKSQKHFSWYADDSSSQGDVARNAMKEIFNIALQPKPKQGETNA